MRHSVIIKKELTPFAFSRKHNIRPSKSLNKVLHLFLLVLPRKERNTSKQFPKNTPSGPHINLEAILNAHRDFGGTIIPRLYISVPGFVLEATGSQIDNLDAGLVELSEEDVFGFEVAVDDVLLAEELERGEELDGEAADELRAEAVVVVADD